MEVDKLRGTSLMMTCEESKKRHIAIILLLTLPNAIMAPCIENRDDKTDTQTVRR